MNKVELKKAPVEKPKFKGHLDLVSNQVVRGWVMSTISDDPIMVDLYIDGKKLMSGLANKPRPRLKEKGLHTTGLCGFIFTLNEKVRLKAISTIEIKVAGDTTAKIGNSPWLFNPNLGQENGLKILVVGLAKSGTSILTYRIADGMGEHKLFFEPKANMGLVDVDIHKQITANPRMLSKSLFYPNVKNNLNNIGRLYDKKIWIVRDPRDHLISTFFYRWRHTGQYKKETFDACLELVKKKEAKPGSVSFMKILNTAQYDVAHFSKQYAKVAQVLSKVKLNWFVLSYEDFVDNKVEHLNTYLGIKVNTEAGVDPSLKRVERSKAYGNWRSWFTQDDVKALKPILNSKLKALGYDESDWNLDKKPKLSSKQGSEYMIKLTEK